MPRLAVLMVLLVPLVGLSGCVDLQPVHVPPRLLDGQASNGWAEESDRSMEDDGVLSAQAARVYSDDAEDDRGYPGILVVQSFRGLLSPDREELRDRLAQMLRDEAEAQNLQVEDGGMRGQRALAGGIVSYYIVLNATGTQESFAFTNDATVRGIGEVFRCTGGATVVAKGFAQVDSARSIGRLQTSRNYDPTTWDEMIQDPAGTIEGFQGSRGLIYNLVCS